MKNVIVSAGGHTCQPGAERMACRTVIWVVDDSSENHQLVANSLPVGWQDHANLRGFVSGEAALAELTQALNKNTDSALPDLVFMDFFMHQLHGAETTERLLKLYHQHARDQDRPTIIGHSSMMSASQSIVAAGGDMVISKRSHLGSSPGIIALIPDVASLISLKRGGATETS